VDLSLERLYKALGVGMHVELNPNLEARLDAAAERASVPVAQLVECALTRYLDEIADDPAQWVAATRQQLPRVWREESFTHWGPPRAN
jgi:predicted DNA-binding protein